MVSLAAFPANYFGTFFLVLTRVSAMLFSAPLINGQAVPSMLKVGLALLLTFLLVPLNSAHLVAVPFEWLPLSLMLLREIGVGLLVGFTANLVFSAVQLAGQFVGLQIGFTLANVIDPLFSQSISVLDQLYTVMAGLIFLSMDGFQMLILSVQQTLDLVPLGTLRITAPLANQLEVLTAGVFVAATRMVLPIMASLLLADIALGLMSRTVPQMNVFIVGMPLKLFLGFLIIVITLPTVGALLSGMFRSTFVDVANLLRLSA